MKIRWTSMEGKSFSSTALPFENLVFKESAERFDKTWKRLRYWSRDFHMTAGATPKDSIVEGDDLKTLIPSYPWGHPAAEVTTWTLNGHVVCMSYRGLLFRIESSYYQNEIQGHSGQWYIVTGWERQVGPVFDILDDGDNVIFSCKEKHDIDDWEVISNLSGQTNRRLARVSVAQKHGQMMPVFLEKIGIRPAQKDFELMPLMQSDFEVARSGRGYVVIGFGKVMFSQTNTPGYYKVVKEYKKSKTIVLVN